MNGSHRLGSCKNIRWDFIIRLHFLQELWGLFLKAYVDNSFMIFFNCVKRSVFLALLHRKMLQEMQDFEILNLNIDSKL